MISIVVPIYNVESFIRRCLDSVITQSYSDFELILVDDGSTDKSLSIAEEYASKDDRIRIIRHSCNRGLLWTRRTGYSCARGEYIVFCDSDDYLQKNSLQKLRDAIHNSNYDIVIANHQSVNNSGRVKGASRNVLRYGESSRFFYKSLLLGEVTHSLWGKIYRKSLFENYDYLVYENFTNSEDGFLLYQVVENANKIGAIDDVVYNYFVNEISSSRVIYTEKSLMSITKFWHLIHEKFKSDSELHELANRRNIVALISILKRGHKFSELNALSVDFIFNNFSRYKQMTRMFTLREICQFYGILVWSKLK